MKIAIVGPGRCGKSHAAKALAAMTRLRYSGSCSRVIAPYAAAHLGLTTAEAFARRHEDRALWRRLGDWLRRDDPAYIARRTLEDAQICVGIRSLAEIEAVRRESLVDVIIWVERDVPPDDTLEFGSEQADWIVENRWDLPVFHGRLRRLANALGVLRTS